ncbi:MAG: tetratricopeptide repeat protein [Spirochaetia bacterium]|nr:tetratricopeptide repeat protein [Spirochaetia bacterium]
MLRWILSKLSRNTPEEGALGEEKWKSNFSALSKKRFVEEDTDSFRAVHSHAALRLQLKRSNLFAWALFSPYRYRNFVSEMQIQCSPDNGHSAAGLLFRYINEENYYYALISNRGYFRFDVVFNGNPTPLIPWLEIPLQQTSSSFKFRIIAHNSSFSFYLDDQWIAETADESFDTGLLAFAGQNYDQGQHAEFALTHMLLESRPVEVEVWYDRWTKVLSVDPQQRLRLAERLYGQGHFTGALVQLRRAFQQSTPEKDGLFILAETYLNLGLYQEALEQIELCLQQDSSYAEAKLEKANLLYLQNRFLETRRYVEQIIDSFPQNSPLWNLYGNAEYAMGRWSEAAQKYLKAVELNGEVPIFHLNAARALDRSDDPAQAGLYYAEASRLFFRQEAFDELPFIFEQIKRIDPDNPHVAAVRGKLLFQEGSIEAAEKIFRSLIERGEAESEIEFLQGLLYMQRGAHAEAVRCFNVAIESVPDFYLYWLKRAECEYLMGSDPAEALAKARELQPKDGWVHNLAGLIKMEQGEYGAARDVLENAYSLLPEETEVVINYSEVKFHTEGLDAALEVFNKQDAPSFNQIGNLYAKSDRLEDATEAYRRAVQLNPDEPVFRENLAAALWDGGYINGAEEQLASLLESTPTVRGYELITKIAMEKGEYQRAFSASGAGLDMDPDSLQLKLLHAQSALHSGAMEVSRLEAEQLLDTKLKTEARELLSRIRDITEEHFECAECGREWWVPLDIPEQSQVRLYGEPPGEMPAGICPSCGRVYCVACASGHMENQRFVCASCGEPLKLSKNGLKYLALQYTGLSSDQ